MLFRSTEMKRFGRVGSHNLYLDEGGIRRETGERERVQDRETRERVQDRETRERVQGRETKAEISGQRDKAKKDSRERLGRARV